jgi:hypothetical protein
MGINAGARANLGRKLTIVAVACSLTAIFFLVLSGFGSRLGLWQFRTGFAILKWSAYLGLAASLLAVVAAALSLKVRQFALTGLALLAFLCGISAFAVPYSWKLKAQSYPRIHDISTDLDHPPQFVAVLPLRQGVVEYGGAAVAAMQLKAYPDLKTLVLGVPMQQAFQAALDAVHRMGWQIVAQVPAEGRIEATDTTFWYGFKDDVVIRVYPAGDRSLVDIRSASRVGVSDVGTNAKRIRGFLANLTHQSPPK